MQTTAIHGIGEYNKVITYEEVAGGTTTTYIGMMEYHNDNPNRNFTDPLVDYAKPYRRIKKVVEDIVGGVTTTITYLPDGSADYNYIRDDGTQNFLTHNYI